MKKQERHRRAKRQRREHPSAPSWGEPEPTDPPPDSMEYVRGDVVEHATINGRGHVGRLLAREAGR